MTPTQDDDAATPDQGLADTITALSSIADLHGWTLTCYGRPVSWFNDTLAEALPAANEHIRTCPHGAMPWATHIAWYPTTLPELNGALVSAAGGSWLNHHLTPASQGDPQ